jgi:ribosome-binding factor A
MTTSAAELGPEDGTDPKRCHDRRTWHRPRSPGRKALQLCGQVADALRAILSGLADEVLQNLTVLSVEPAPHTGRLLVTVAAPATADVTDRRTAAEHLTRATGRIRSDVASAVHRRKAPELSFAVL